MAYGVRPLFPERDRMRAERAAAKMLAKEFRGDPSLFASFLHWLWQRETRRAKESQAAGRDARPIVWRFAFASDTLNEFRVAQLPRMAQSLPDGTSEEDEDDQGNDLPVILIDVDEERVNDEAVAALATRPNVYARGGSLVSVVTEGKDNRPRIRPLWVPVLRERLAAAADWRKATDDGDVAVHPPDWAVKAIAGRGQWRDVRPLEGIIEAPTLRPDMTVLDVPGYDQSTGLLYLPNAVFPPVPAAPTREQGMAAMAALLEVVRGLPDLRGSAHRSTWLALVLTLVARHGIDGPDAIVCVRRNDAGAPARGCSWTRAPTSPTAATRRSCRRSRTRRRSESGSPRLVLEGAPLAVLDNCSDYVGTHAVIDALLTSSEWRDRILGRTETATTKTRMVLACTGNNLMFQGDTLRRVIHARLECRLSRAPRSATTSSTQTSSTGYAPSAPASWSAR